MCVVLLIIVIYVWLLVEYSLVVILHYCLCDFGMHGIMAVLFLSVILYAQLEHASSRDNNLHHTHHFCSIEVSMSWSWCILNLRGVCRVPSWRICWIVTLHYLSCVVSTTNLRVYSSLCCHKYMLTLSKYDPLHYPFYTSSMAWWLSSRPKCNTSSTHETIGWEPLKVYLVVNVYENLGWGNLTQAYGLWKERILTKMVGKRKVCVTWVFEKNDTWFFVFAQNN